MIRTQIQLTEQQMQALKEAAAREGSSLAELVRRGVDVLLREAGSAGGDPWERAAAVSGRFRSSRRDLARRHDDHLASAFAE